MKKIAEYLYQFSTYIPPMDFTIHQYLLAVDPAILFAAGTVRQAEAALPAIKEILEGKPLKYIFVSHVESDEAGGIEVFQNAYPEITMICSELAARELPGYGFTCNMQAVREGIEIKDGELSLQFIAYPSEVHLQDGLVCMDEKSGIMYSSDLFLRYGNGIGQVVKGDWIGEINALNEERIPTMEKLQNIKNSLEKWEPKLVAVGHGFCLEV